MKIRLKGFKNLIKAIRNRDHLVPVITLISGKTKTFYAKRYVSPGEAMVTAKEDFKINPYQEAIFESKDGKVKNITEKEVLEMYDAAGKPGILQEFIKQNFKKPKVKANTKDNGQLSFDNMMQGNEPTKDTKIKDDKLENQGKDKENEESGSGITITGPIYDDDERPTYYINDNGNVIETQDPKIVDKYRQKQKEANNQAGTDDKDNNQNNDNEGKENPGKENKKPQNKITDPKQIIVDKLQQKGAFIWKKGGYERLYFNEVGKEIADRIAKEEGVSQESSTYKALDYFTNKMYLNLKDGKAYIPSNGSKGYELDSKYREKIVQYVKEIFKNTDTTSNENVKLLSAEGEEKLLQAIGGKVSRGNPYRAYIDPLKMWKLTDPEDGKNPWTSGAISRRRTLDYATINLITGEITSKRIYNEDIIPRAQEVINKLISEIKAETEDNKPLETEDNKPLETEMLNILGIKLNNKSDTTKLKPRFNALKKLIGKEGSVINGVPYTESVSKEIDQALKNATFNLDKMKISVEDGNDNLQKLLDEALNSKVEDLKAKQKAEEERENSEAEKESYEGKEIILSRKQENAVRTALGAPHKKNKDDNWIYPSNDILESIIGLKDGKLNGEKITDTEVRQLRNQYYNGRFNLLTGEFSRSGKSDSPIQKQITDYINNLIEDIKNSTDEEIEKLAFRNVGMDGGLINFIKTRENTTRIKSKNEYKQVKNINELVDQVKPIKDAHTKIKGRAIMDMFGIGADLITKADGKPFPIGPGAAGYCSRYYNPETGEANIKEIGVVSELYTMNNAYEETRVTIHECMHAKLTLSGKNNLMDSIYTSDTEGKEMSLKVEEPMVELAGHAVARQIHGDEANKSLHAYATFIADFLPRVWTSDIFKNVRKQGSLGIGQEIAKQLNSHNVDFINKVYDSFNANDDKRANSNRIKAIETKMLERTDKVEKIQNDTGVSSIAYLVEELKRGTISLEGALNSSQYRELAAVLIAKFLEDEDLEALEGLALSF